MYIIHIYIYIYIYHKPIISIIKFIIESQKKKNKIYSFEDGIEIVCRI